MRPTVVALGVFGTIVGVFLPVTVYDMVSMPVYMGAMELLRDQYRFGLDT